MVIIIDLKNQIIYINYIKVLLNYVSLDFILFYFITIIFYS